jgi:hypothetical protein
MIDRSIPKQYSAKERSPSYDGHENKSATLNSHGSHTVEFGGCQKSICRHSRSGAGCGISPPDLYPRAHGESDNSLGDQGSIRAWSTSRFFGTTRRSGLAVNGRRLAQESENSLRNSFDHHYFRRKPPQILFRPRRVDLVLSELRIQGRVHTSPQSSPVF